MGTSLDEYKDRKFKAVYVIYDADVAGSETDINRMSPASHMPAGWGNDHRLMSAIAKRFTQTEDDEEYHYGYLGEETGNIVYRAVKDTPECKVCASCGNPCQWSDSEDRLFHGTADDDEDQAPEDSERDLDHDAISGYQGRHRKWVAELTRYEWLQFADAYYVDLDNGYPVDYEDTMGSLTEHGLLFAVSVDNSEGWQDYSGPMFVSSSFYVSFAG